MIWCALWIRTCSLLTLFHDRATGRTQSVQVGEVFTRTARLQGFHSSCILRDVLEIVDGLQFKTEGR